MKKITAQTASRICALVIGPAGIGKTSLLRSIAGQKFDPATGTWEQAYEPAGRVCTLSAESGLLCVRDLVTSGQVEGYEIESYKDMADILAQLGRQEFQERYQWIFIDSLTEISARCVEYAKSRFPSSSDTFKVWGEYNDAMTALIKAYRDMTQYNVVFTCLETIDKDQNNVRYKAPMVSGSGLKERLTSYFDEVLYMDRLIDENGAARIVFKTREMGVAKDRSGRLAAIEEPSLLEIRNKILA